MLIHRRLVVAASLFALACASCNTPPLTALETQPFIEREDEHRQTSGGPGAAVDLLFVIDNSGSMAEEQDNLAANFDAFIDAIIATRADFRIAIVSTDMSDPRQSGRFLAKPGNPVVLAPDTRDLQRVFAENARLGTMGDGFEKGLAAIEAALSPPLLGTTNAGFLREGAILGVIVVSDEDDCSHPPGAIPELDGDECTRNVARMTPVARYTDFLRGLKPSGEGRLFFAAISGPDLAEDTTRVACAASASCESGLCADGFCCPVNPSLAACRNDADCASVPGTACHGRKCLPVRPERALDPRTCSCYAAGTGIAVPGTRYLDLLRTFGPNGIYASICAPDWAQSLRDIAGLAVDLICKYPLSTLKANPNVLPASARDLVVKVGGVEVLSTGWTYNCPEDGRFEAGSISFAADTCPAEGATLQLVYEPAPAGSPPVACGPRAGGVADCPSGERCGNCHYCEPAP